MNITPKFYPNLWGDLQGNLDTSVWNSVTEAWNGKRYLDAFHRLLDYTNPQLRQKYGNTSQTTFQVPHGSVIVTIEIKGDSVYFSCPMVDISAANRVPLLRRAAEINFWPLVLAQMKLDSNNLSFQYNSTLDTCEPYKTYYVLKEICLTADRYDDEFKEKFKAKSLVEPQVNVPQQQQIDAAWNNVNEIINETFMFCNYFESQRWFGSSLDMLVLAVKRIDLASQVQGFVKSEMERINGEMANNQMNLNDRLLNGKKFLQKIQQDGKDAFAKGLYQTEVFIPEKWRSNAAQVKSSMQNAFNQTAKYHSERNYIASVIESLYCIYDLFYRNNMDSMVNNVLIGSLTNAAGKSWEESSAILFSGLQTINALAPSNN